MHPGPSLLFRQLQSTGVGDPLEGEPGHLQLHIQDLQLAAAVISHIAICPGHRLLQDLHYILVIGKAHLQIYGDGLIQMAPGIMLLRPEYGTDLINPIHARSHQHLFVELRALVQEGLLLKVADGKEISPSLCGCGHDLGGEDLNYPLSMEIVPEAEKDCTLDLECSQDAGPADVHEPGVKAGVQLALHLLRGIQRKRHLGGA